ncbi:FecR family protein [Butyricimonas faecalis]|jgi:fecR protein|uniref:FecR family protein n=1 Tax=Butyricimonas faecalis TaxID=2093856 RepID=A0A3S9VX65_9BACT|nr:FecR family protein [Butyricimonas faecalis]AZS31123.1 FecR family protein [Butyricimonas faecalis]MBS7157028.1 FecR family protein [Sanguibacteroides justesenii]
MKRMRKDIEISDLIYKFLRGETSKSEDELLEAWCLEPRNRKLFMELRDANHLYEGVTDMCNVDTSIPFENVNAQIRKKKRVHLMKYVAGVAAVLMVGMVFVFFMEEEKNEPVRQVLLSSVSKGKTESFATLVTTSGKVVYLEDSVKQESLKERNKETLKPIENESDPQVIPTQEVEYNVLTTSKQGNIKIVLYDGSLVWLNAGSELRYPNTFVENQRVVYLKGEAYFDVTKDRSHPFIVKTISSEISVLGTSFNVNARENSCVTTLVEGRVRMKHGIKDSVELRAGQQAWVAGTEKIRVQEVDTRYYTSWMNNMFAFRETSLREIATVLEDWYECKCRFESAALENIPYTTMVERYPDVDSVLQILAGTGDFRYTRIGDIIIIKEK